jgi:WD40 repeat protein/subtilisin-like proprotein convertase family protein
MPSVTQPLEFFVVGGPVQPDRACYIERTADRLLADAIAARRSCWVVGSRATGKTSLLLRAAHAARRSGVLAAMVDWRRLVEQAGSAPESGLRMLIERLAAELGLGAVVDSWWDARDAHTTDNPLVGFLWQVVLTNTTAPIVVLVDDFEAAAASPLARDFLAAAAECHARRGREPDFARLCFVLAGCLAPHASEGEEGDATLAAAETIEPADFSADEAYGLAVAFGGEPELAQALLDRICAWTGGQPYLTQKVARGVARKGGRLEDVERVVAEQFLTPTAAASDPLLRHVRAWLCEPSRPARRARRVVQRVAAGAKVTRPADTAVWERLWLSGAVREATDRRLVPRNRVVKELVAARWLEAAKGFRRVAIAAVLLVAVLAAGGYWYTQRLPVDDIATLTSGGASLAADEDAYQRLRGLPGFADRAERLWLEALGRRSRAAATLVDAVAVDTRLRELPGQDAPADRLLGEFWLRRARVAAHREQRDAALLMAQRAAALPAAEPHAAAYLAELVGGDYRYLERSLRLATAPGYWHMRFDDSALVVLDAEQRVLRAPFGVTGGEPLGDVSARLTALKPAALTRALMLSGEGTAGELTLSLAVQHPEGGELLVTLRAPGGTEAAVQVPRGDGTTVERLVFEAVQGSPLAQLADEGLEGTWRLTIVDRAEGNTGFLVGWGLTRGPASANEDFPDGLAIPDPTRAEDVMVRTVGDRALVVPTTPGAIGTVALWNLATGRLEHDFTLPAPPRHVALDATGSRVLAATENELSLWNAADGALVAELGTQTEFVLLPVFSADGAYFAIAERVEGDGPLVSVLRSSDASLVASSEGADGALEWQLGPGARYFALLGPANVVRVLETRRGTELVRLQHTTAVQRVLDTQDGNTLVTVDAAGAIVAWLFANGSAIPRYIGRTASAASISVAAGRLAYAWDDGAVAIVATATGAPIARVRQPHAADVAKTQLAADGTQLVTQYGAALRRGRLPSAAPTPAATAAAAAPPVLALDRGADIVAFGLRSGQLEIGPRSERVRPGSMLAFFGHRGPITAAVVDTTLGLAATGGADGMVRLWDSATGEPTGIVVQPAAAAIDAVAVSADGGAVASAAGRTVRIADIGTGRVTEELTVEGAVVALRFAPGSRLLAVADSSGAVTLTSGARRRTAQLGAAATALAFAPDGTRLVVGDAAGALRLVGIEDAELSAVVREWPGPIRWLELSSDGRVLFVATNEWLHALDASTPALEPTSSRLLPLLPTPHVASPTSASIVRFAGFDLSGALVATSFDLAAAPDPAPPDGAVLVSRDWSAALGLTLGDDGEPEPFYP